MKRFGHFVNPVFQRIALKNFLLPSPGRLSLLCRKPVRLIGEANYSQIRATKQALSG